MKGEMGLSRKFVFMFIAALIIILACFAILLALFNLSSKENGRPENLETAGIIVGFSQIGAESAWRKHNTLSIKEAAQSKGIRLLFSNAEQKQENQIKAIRSFISYRVDVIAFAPVVANGWDNVLREAKIAGIPVLVTDRKITTQDESLYAGFIGTDSVEEGRNAARFIVKKFNVSPDKPEQACSDKSGQGTGPLRIIEITGTKGSSPALGRTQGFREELSKYNNSIEIIYTESGDFIRSKGYEIAHRILKTYMPIDVIYSHNDSMTLGIIEAMKELGIRPGKDIVLITIDAEQATIDALIAGEINCVIECNPKTGPAIMDLAIDLVTGRPIPRLLHVKEEVFTENDVDLEFLPPRGY